RSFGHLAPDPDKTAVLRLFQRVAAIGTRVALGWVQEKQRTMAIRPLVTVALVALAALSGCAAGGHGNGSSQSAYDRICRSPSMTEATSREAYWCWQQVGAKSQA